MKNVIGVVIAIGVMILIDRAIERHQRFVRFKNEDLTTLFEVLEKIGRSEVENDNANSEN